MARVRDWSCRYIAALAALGTWTQRSFVGLLLLSIFMLSDAAHAQIARTEQFDYEPLEYTTGGETIGCGIRLTAINQRMIFLDASFNVNVSRGKVPFSVFKVTAKRVEIAGEGVRAQDVYVHNAWLDNGRTPPLTEHGRARAEDTFGILITSTDFEGMLRLLPDLVERGAFRVGFNEAEGLFDHVFEFTQPAPDAVALRVNECQLRLLETAQKYFR